MIRIENLNKTYKSKFVSFKALDNINLTINDGELVAIQGTSGAGKSTLLNIIGCLDTFDSGKYYYNEINVEKLNDGKTAKLRNKEIGFVMQDFSLINHKSVLFNVMLPMYFNRTKFRLMKEKALNALQLVGIEDQADKKANQLSGGQRQRVAIARAIVNNPSLILADEPTGALDSKTSASIMELLKKLNEEGITIIVVTHDNKIAEFCNRKLIISDGRILE